MRTIWLLVKKDLLRDWKRPWAILLFSSLPLIMTGLMAAIFGGSRGASATPTLHVAVMDNDKDLLTRVLRSISSQGDATQKLQLHFVKSQEQGILQIEEGKVSAFVIFPTNMTVDLLNGRSNSITLYENPSQQILPKVVRQGVLIGADGLSAAATLLNEPLSRIRALIHTNQLPSSVEIGTTASEMATEVGHLRQYVFPPIVNIRTVAASEFEGGTK